MSNKSYRHTSDKRAHIPSKEEAGYEKSNNKVREAGERYRLPVNPILHRGQDPELFWMDKYKHDEKIRELLDKLAESKADPETKALVDELRTALTNPPDEAWEEMLDIDIRSLYRTEHIAPELLIEGLAKLVKNERDQGDLFQPNELFGNSLEKDELSKVSDYYTHSDGWSNRMILGDSLRVMTSLLEREGMAGQVQMIYIDPPYGIKYNSNWQMKINDRTVKDGKDEHITEEPEQVKAYRDTWEKGIHSYLSYLRKRLNVAKELLKTSGSCFVQISDENVHLVRNLMDEVFGSENFIRLIFYKTTSGLGQNLLDKCGDYLVWYAKDINEVKYRELFKDKKIESVKDSYGYVEEDGKVQTVHQWEKKNGIELTDDTISKKGKLLKYADLKSQSGSGGEIEIEGKKFVTNSGSWKTNQSGINNLIKENRIYLSGKVPNYKRYHSDFPVMSLTNMWDDTISGGDYKRFVVQTTNQIIQRCLLMTTDPGDLVLDPTCGSGTSAHVAEEWGRRWITIDTSRIALNIAKIRLMSSTFPYFYLQSEVNVERTQNESNEINKKITYKNKSEQLSDTKQGFVYREVPHITLRQIANNLEPETEILYDKPFVDKNRMRVSGPFTVETLQNLNPVSPSEIEAETRDDEEAQKFEEMVYQHLQSAGIKNGIKQEQAVFTSVTGLSNRALHAEGYYNTGDGERKTYFHIGPKFGTVSNESVNEAIKECRAKGDGDWLVILGFSFESEIENQSVTTSLGSFEVTKVRMADDLLQDGLLKKDKKAASFVTIGEPDIEVHKNEDGTVQLEVQGIDIYDPIKNQIKPRNAKDIAYWSVDDEYDGSNFVVRQIFFSGGSKDEFKDIKKDLKDQEKYATKKAVEHTLRIEIDDEAFDRLYGLKSHPIEYKEGKKVAVRVVSQFGEETTKVITL
ncbi:MAG: site-specific DNA-methyltransferase [Gracilimonas sp.]|uniref:site-specific DNA-methyltransferase n=1 Tax=Gracilimonas sp. TaxID=1974203 RepID=UPI0019C8AC29|nr:site-specific DNA-methyltransferase [Gracilimonas sp.]MBD3615377.1 site-specific DNA-methyltransferase [Gracilimonas sp.]